MSKLEKKYRALELYRKELQEIFKVYDIPFAAIPESSGPRGISLVHSSWYRSVEEILDKDMLWNVSRRVERLIDEIREIREIFNRDREASTFKDRLDRYVSKASSKMRHLFILNEGGMFDFRVHVDLRGSLSDYIGDRNFGVQIEEIRHAWYRGRRVKNFMVNVSMTPRTVASIREEWFFFRVKGKPQFVLNAEEIKGHVFNEQGSKVYRLDCFGLVDDDAQEYKYYLVQNESLLNEDGHPIFAHGKDVNSAMSLLNRRVKSETIKRLGI